MTDTKRNSSIAFTFTPRQITLKQGTRPIQQAAPSSIAVEVRFDHLQSQLEVTNPHLTPPTETNTQDCPQSSPPSSIPAATSDEPGELDHLKVPFKFRTRFKEVPSSEQVKSTDSESSPVTFALKVPAKVPTRSVPIASGMVEPPAKRARRTDSAAMWDKDESTTAPKAQRPSEDLRDPKRKDSQRDPLNGVKDRRRNEEGRDGGRRRSRSRERYQSRRERSRSTDRPAKDKDRDHDGDRVRGGRRDRDRERGRDHRGSRRERERSRSADRHRSSKGRFEPSTQHGNYFD
jgi:hypothetical protein